jgi:RNA-binding protein YlmH
MDTQIDDLEARASSASESWAVDVTDFLSPELADAVEARFDGRGDVAAVRVGGVPGARRSRFVLTNPDLVASVDTSEHATLLRVCADFDGSDALANVLVNIGVELKSVGDVRIEDGETAYLVVAPESAKVVKRLLPKRLSGGRGGAVTIRPHDVSTDGEVEGELQELEVQRLDKRARNR